MTLKHTKKIESRPDAEAYWECLISLHNALLHEPLIHRRRKLILKAIKNLTGYSGQVWFSKDGPLTLTSSPPLIQQVAQTYQPAIETSSEKKLTAPPMQALPVFDRETARFLGVIYGAFTQLPELVTDALIRQIQLAFDIHAQNVQVEQLTTIAEVGRIIASELDLDKLLQLVVNLLHERFGYSFVHIFTVHLPRNLIAFKTGYGQYVDYFKGLTFDLDNERGIIPWVGRTGKSALINNADEDSLFEPLSIPGIEIKSELTVPLVFGDDVLGIFDIQSEALNAFTPDDQWLLETLATNITVALRNAILYRSEQWRGKAADSLRQVAGVVRSKETLDNILLAILGQIATIFPITFATIWLKSDDGYTFKSGYNIQNPPDITQPINHPWFDRLIIAEAPQLRSPTDQPSPLAEHLPPDHSAVGAVLEADGNILGVLVLVHLQPNRFGREALRLAEIFASQAAVVIQNTELYHQAKEQAWISTLLLQIAEATRNLQSFDEVLAVVVGISFLIADLDACLIWLYNPYFDNYICEAVYGFSGERQSQLDNTALNTDSEIVIRLSLLMQPLIILPHQAKQQLPLNLSPALINHTTLVLPLINQGQLNGIMMMAFNPKEVISEERLPILSGIAHQTAAAIQTVQLIEAQQAEAYVSVALLQVAQVVVAANTLAEILETIVRITPILTGVSHCLIFLYNGQQNATLAATYGLKINTLPLTLPLATFRLLRQALETGQHQQIDRLSQFPDTLQSLLAKRFKDVITPPGLILPISVQGQTIGALMVIETYVQSDLIHKRHDILTGIAYQTALAIDNARLHSEQVRQRELQRDLILAREIQTSFIPDILPTLPNWELATFLEMVQEVGGDFFDVIQLSPTNLVVIIADVADKGLPAALFMARSSSFFRATALEVDEPAQILARVNALLVSDADQGMFVTAFCATLDLQTGDMAYASAGHNPPILITQSGEMIDLQAKGIVLGVVDTFDFEQKSIQLKQGDGLLLYTDGITEAFNPQAEEFGKERLQQVIKTSLNQPAPDFIKAIHQAVLNFSQPHPQSDDFTLVFLRRK